MKLRRYHSELGAIAACTKRFMEDTNGLGQRAVEGSTRACLIFDRLFLSKKSAESAASIGVDLIVIVKTDTK